jgi:hypothetical protein
MREGLKSLKVWVDDRLLPKKFELRLAGTTKYLYNPYAIFVFPSLCKYLFTCVSNTVD